MIYSSSHIIYNNNDCLINGAIVVEDYKIIAIDKYSIIKEKYKEHKCIELGDMIIFPGFINAYTSLEDGFLRHSLESDQSYSRWTTNYLECKKEINPSKENYLNAVQLGTNECLMYGTTSVADLSFTGSSFKFLYNFPIRSTILLGINASQNSNAEEDFNNSLANASGYFGGRLSSWGVLMPSIYERKEKLQNKALELADENEVPIYLDLTGGKSENFFFSKRIIFSPQKYKSTIDYLEKNNLLRNGINILNPNKLSNKDISILKKHSANLIICPRVMHKFGILKSSFPKLIDSGLNIAIGTGSLSMVPNLDLIEDMYLLRTTFPNLPAKTIISMATLGSAKAIKKEKTIGALKEGYIADFIALKPRNKITTCPFEKIITEDLDVKLVVVGGREILV